MAHKTIKALASELGCSYENVRLFLKRYDSELSEHIFKNGRTQYLDEFAVEFIKNKRTENPVTIQTIERDDYIKQLENENKTLLLTVKELQENLIKTNEIKHSLELENLELKLLKATKTEEIPPKKHWWQRTKKDGSPTS